MKKRHWVISVVTLILLTALLLPACTEQEPTPTTAPVPAPTSAPAPTPVAASWEWPQMMAVSSMPEVTPIYMVTVGWTSQLEKSSGMTVRVAPEEVMSQRFRNIASNKNWNSTK